MKSFLLINRLNNFNEAKKVCEALEESIESKATLAVIESKDEQNFINRYLYEDLGIVERVWIGMKKDLKTDFTKITELILNTRIGRMAGLLLMRKKVVFV